MTKSKLDGVLQTLLVAFLVVVVPVLLFNYFSIVGLVTSVVLLKVYQIVGGGGVHLWVSHGLGEKNIDSLMKSLIGVAWLLCGISSASFFSKYHILHHAYSDKEGDPHSPNNHSATKLTLGLWAIDAHKYDKYITESIQERLDAAYARISSNWLLNLTDKYYYLLIALVISSLLFIDVKTALYIVLLPMILNIIDGNFFFVYYFHKHGSVRDISWVDYWILNSGQHKRHHKWVR